EVGEERHVRGDRLAVAGRSRPYRQQNDERQDRRSRTHRNSPLTGRAASRDSLMPSSTAYCPALSDRNKGKAAILAAQKNTNSPSAEASFAATFASARLMT